MGKMMYKIIILVTTYCVTTIKSEEGPSFRYDYTFNEEADGWFKFHLMPSDWNTAKIRCNAEGAILVSPTTVELQRALLKFVTNEPITAIFTGVHSSFSDRVFSSVDGVPLERLPITWAAGQPAGLTKNCLVMMTRDGTMANAKCGDGFPYVCYKKKTNLIKTQCGTHDQEYKLESRTGRCYKFHRRALDWTNAYLTCMAEGGYLAVINSELEALVLKEIFGDVSYGEIISINSGIAHVGYRDLRDGGSWMTIHGESLPESGYARWGNDQPDNSTADNIQGEACGSMLRDGTYNDVSCDLTVAFICEKEVNSLE